MFLRYKLKSKTDTRLQMVAGCFFFSSPFCFLVSFIETITQGPVGGLLFWKSPLAVSSEVLSSFQQFTLLLSVAVFTHLSPFSVNKTCLSNLCESNWLPSRFSCCFYTSAAFDQLWKSHSGFVERWKSSTTTRPLIQSGDSWHFIRLQQPDWRSRTSCSQDQLFCSVLHKKVNVWMNKNENTGWPLLWVYSQHESVKVSQGNRNTCCHSQRNPKSSSSNQKVRGLMNDDKNKKNPNINKKVKKKKFQLIIKKLCTVSQQKWEWK